MNRITKDSEIRDTMESEHDRTGGIYRLAPCWVGRPGIISPGRRLKLRDEYISSQLAVNERWLASTTYADNGVYNGDCPEDHGLSYVVTARGWVQLKDAIGLCSDLLLGKGRMWNVLPKFFDNRGRIPFHLHPCDRHVRNGLKGKPESYHFPIELNINPNSFPRSYFGVDPACANEMILSSLRRFHHADNKLTSVSNAVDLIPGTGWHMPPCTLHAPGSLVTYELQYASDVTCIPESRVDDIVMPRDLLDRDLRVTVEANGIDAVFAEIMDMLACPHSGNRDNFRREYFRPPIVVYKDDNCSQALVIYRCGRASEKSSPDLYSAKNTRVCADHEWVMNEGSAFGVIALSGFGNLRTVGKQAVPLQTSSVFHTRAEVAADELFIAATAGTIHVSAESREELSFYQHFAASSNPLAASINVPNNTGDYV